MLVGEGAATTVNSERTPMRVGDVIITPPTAWHDHGNPGNGPTLWPDGLDIPVVQLLDTCSPRGWARTGSQSLAPTARTTRDTGPTCRRSTSAAVTCHRWSTTRTRDAQKRIRVAATWDPCHGSKTRHTNPATGTYPMTTIGTFMQPVRVCVGPARPVCGAVLAFGPSCGR